ncbi:tetratricopeptide repeat protein [Aquimarina megaterium]|uniref:tetratricopeptide repeat protein n=1 Tax=Aquimarina megaterium TaxID=1443666 RepID=UPI0009456D2D|nr:tetratricopeptide repeat protein [Aquimarina megaterium]
MKLFGFNKKVKNDKFQITEPDKNWVEDNFKWLIQVYGYPNNEDGQILISEKYFPKTFRTKEIKVQNLIDDLCDLMNLNSDKISFELHSDLSDSYGTPYQIEGKAFDIETEITNKNNYKLHIKNSAIKRKNRLVFSLIYELTRICLIEDELKYDSGSDTSLFIYLAGVYFGFGFILSQNLLDVGRLNDGFWETKWSYASEMPNEVMVFALAIHSQLIGQENPEWKSELPQKLRSQFDTAINLLKESPSAIFNKAELDANDLFHQANQEYQNGNYNSAISNLQKILFLIDDEILKADVYNNIGYYQLRSGDYEKSISNFQKVLQIDSNYGFAYDNLGYALIQTGQLEEGKQQLEKALETENNDNAYTYRNFALYYFAKNEIDKAESNFQLAFEFETVSVDLLELHYANFLIKQDKIEKGMEYLKKAVKKGEPEAIKRMNGINNN